MDFTKFKLNDDRMLIEVVPKRHQITKAGLTMPENAGNIRIITCRILQVGPGRITVTGDRVEVQFKVGDFMQTGSDCGFMFRLDMEHPDKEQRLIMEAECFWVLENYMEDFEDDETSQPATQTEAESAAGRDMLKQSAQPSPESGIILAK